MRSDEDEKNNCGKVTMVYKYFAWYCAVDYEQKDKQPDQKRCDPNGLFQAEDRAAHDLL